MKVSSVASTKQFIVTSSNIAILALCVAGVAKNWSQSAFQLFLATKLKQVWPCLLIYPSFLLIMPLLPRPEKVSVKTAAAPSLAQARFMAIATAAMDYVTVGGLFCFWDRVCRLEDGSLCSFTAAGTFLVGAAVMSIKDEIQCRFLWRKFISPYKVNSLSCSWKPSLEHFSFSSPSAVLSLLGLCCGGKVSFEVLSAKTVVQAWLENGAMLAVSDVIMHFLHKWMHEKAYFLHKKHHEGKADLTSSLFNSFDLLDLFAEGGAGILVFLMSKQLLGLDPKIHLLSHHLLHLCGFQHHSGNPYAVYFFNPFLDYLARPTLCHNLHHAIQNDYHLFVPYSHFFSAVSKQNDTEKYNKHMKTQFPLCV